MAQISAIFLRHCHRAIIFYFSATVTCATFLSSRQWRGGAKSGASAQHSSWNSKMILTHFNLMWLYNNLVSTLTS